MDSNVAGSSSDQNAEDTEEVYEMHDLLQKQDEMMEQVAAVLGAGDDFNCSYSQGYLNRQALYACLTCIPEAKTDHTKSAGLCLACSFNCHDGHNLVELYTKRNFRCDCGNKKYPTGTPCTLQAEKDEINVLNKYNQNFSGLYCTCSKPYPDPEDPIEDEMIQCIICEDWYHSRHLGTAVPVGYDEMICLDCVKKNDFLLYYDGLTVTRISKAENVGDINVEDTKGEAILSDTTAEDVAKINEDPPNCTRPKIKSTSVTTKFMEDVSWRQKLCTCSRCTSDYEKNGVTFLLDAEDTVQSYEEKGKQKVKELNEKTLEKETKYLNSMGRVPMMEAISGYNDFKEELNDFFQKFAKEERVIRVEDVNEFFTELKARKRQKTEMPYYCR